MKKMITLLLAASLCLIIAGCSDSESSSSEATLSANDTSSSAEGEATEFEITALAEPIAEGPVLITPIGQSADAALAKSLLDTAEIECSVEELATADNLADAKTLMLVVGGSTKGLGAAGVDPTQELERANTLIEAAKAGGIPVISIHIGGEMRRGALTDDFFEPCFGQADYVVIMEEGDEDNLMKGIVSENNIPTALAPSMVDVLDALSAAFK